MSFCLQPGNRQKILYCLRRFPETIQQFFQHIILFFPTLYHGNPLVDIQLLIFIANVFIRDIRINIQIHHRLIFFLNLLLTFQLPDRFIQHLAIQIVSYSLHMSMLRFSQEITGSTDLQIPHGNLKSTSQFCKFTNGRKSLLCHFLEHLIAFIHEKCIGCPVGTAYTPTQLIQLRQSHGIGIVNNHGIDIGDIQSCLNNRRRHQYINVTIDKVIHDPFQFPFLHLAVCKGHICLRHQLCNGITHLHNGIDTVVDIINLPTPIQLPANGFPDHLFVILAHIGLDLLPFIRCFLQHTHVTDSDQTHVESSWNRCCCQRQHINIILQLFDLFFMRYTEALFFVHNQQTKIFELHIFRQHTMGTYQDIYCAFFQILQCLFLFCRCAETTQQIYPHREILHALYKGIVMLLRQDRSWHQIHHLFILLHCLKCRTNGYLCFSKSHISTDQTIHDLGTLHVLLGIRYRQQLIIGLLKLEHLFKLSLPYSVRTIDKSLLFLSGRIKLHQILCHDLHRLVNTGLRLVPFLPTQLIQLRRLCICTGIFLDHIRLRGQYIKIAATAVFNLHVVFDDLIYFNLLNTPVNAQSMTFMHHKIAHIQVCKALNFRTFIGMTFLPFFLFSSKNITFCQYRKTDQWIFIAMMQIAISHHDFSRLNLPIPVIRIKTVQLILLQIRSQSLRSGSGS